MYIPAHFDESRPEVLWALIDAHPLATLVTLTPGGLNANHIPLRLHATESAARMAALVAERRKTGS
jgi:transcriptional regulator